jgi:hypothetical protein
MFEHFDFSALDDPTFKEDAVREEIIAPILKGVGYSPTGHIRVTRSQNLKHPFVMIGSKRHTINIVPDYTLYSGSDAVMVLDAKAPDQEIVNSYHTEQAYSYAIHADIRAHHYGLCNGRELVVYAVDQWDPLLRINICDVDARWNDVLKALHPHYLQNPECRDFLPDYGFTVYKIGLERDVLHIFPSFYLQFLTRVNDELYTGTATFMLGENEYLVSFDFSVEMYHALVAELPHKVAVAIKQSLTRAPYHANLGHSIILTCSGYLGEITKGQHDEFVPIMVTSVGDVAFDATAQLPPRTERQGEWPLIHLHLSDDMAEE